MRCAFQLYSSLLSFSFRNRPCSCCEKEKWMKLFKRYSFIGIHVECLNKNWIFIKMNWTNSLIRRRIVNQMPILVGRISVSSLWRTNQSLSLCFNFNYFLEYKSTRKSFLISLMIVFLHAFCGGLYFDSFLRQIFLINLLHSLRDDELCSLHFSRSRFKLFSKRCGNFCGYYSISWNVLRYCVRNWRLKHN